MHIHKNRFVLGAAFSALAAAFANLGGAAAQARSAFDEAPSLADLAASIRTRKTRGPGRKNYHKRTETRAYVRRQVVKRRWLNGLAIPEADRIALEEAAAARAPLLARRARMWRRQEESKVRRKLYAAYDAAREAGVDPEHMKVTAERARWASLLWMNDEPFPQELMSA